MYRKKPKLNHVNEEVETIEVIDTDTVVNDNAPPAVFEETHQPSTSKIQIIQNKHNVEVSSSSKPRDKKMDIMQKYKEIKIRNDALKADTYTQY